MKDRHVSPGCRAIKDVGPTISRIETLYFLCSIKKVTVHQLESEYRIHRMNKEVLCEENTLLWISKLCLCVSVRWCFIEPV